MENIVRYVLSYVARDESGAELPEWVIWVAVLATVGGLLLPIVQTGLANAFTTVLNAVPGVGGS
jgi:hypothetical protein